MTHELGAGMKLHPAADIRTGRRAGAQTLL